jgi:hypothetical protein
VPTWSKQERDRLNKAANAVWDTLRHVKMPAKDYKALEAVGYDLLDWVHDMDKATNAEAVAADLEGLTWRAAVAHAIVEDGKAPGSVCIYEIPDGSFVVLTPEEAAAREGQCDLVMPPIAEGSELAFRGDKALKPEQALDWATRLEQKYGIPGPWRMM